MVTISVFYVASNKHKLPSGKCVIYAKFGIESDAKKYAAEMGRFDDVRIFKVDDPAIEWTRGISF